MEITLYQSDFRDIGHESTFDQALIDCGIIDNNKELTEKGNQLYPDVEDWYDIDEITLVVDYVKAY